jgi:hypothetical protein
MVMDSISVEEARLALSAAATRLEKAQQAAKDHATQHHGWALPDDVQVELDEALRHFQKSEADLRELSTTTSAP